MTQLRPFGGSRAEVAREHRRWHAADARRGHGAQSRARPVADRRPVRRWHDAPPAPKTSRLRIGDIVREMGLATDEQIESAIARQRETHQRLGQVLVRRASSRRWISLAHWRAKFGVEVIDLTTTPIDPAAANLVPERACRRYGVVPVRYVDESTLLVAMVDPANIFALDDLRILTGLDIQPAIASEEDILAAISRLSRLDEAVEDRRRGARGRDRRRDRRHPRGHRGRADRQAGQRRDRPGGRRRRLGHPLRAAGQGAPRPLPHRRRAARGHVRPARMQSGVLSRLKIMADLDIAERRMPQDGRMGLMVGGKPIDMRVATPADRLRREDRAPPARQVQRDAGPRGPGLQREGSAPLSPLVHAAVRRHPGDRADRLGQVHHAVRHAEHPQLAGEEHHHRRGPGRVPPAGHQPGADQPEGRPDLRLRPALDPALRPRHRDDRRDPRPRDGADRHRVRPHRPPGAVHPAHQRRAGRPQPSHRDGHRAVPHVVGRGLRARPAPGAPAVRALQGGVRGHPRDAGQERLPAGGAGEAGDHALPGRGLPALQQHRVQGPARPLRGHGR